MSVEGLKALVRRNVEEIWNKGNLDLISEAISPDYVYREEGKDFIGPDGYRQLVERWRTTFPDGHYTIQDMVAEGDTVASRLEFRGTFKGKLGDINPTGRQVTFTEAAFSRWVNSKAVQMSAFTDWLSIYRQLGVAPPER